MTFFSHFKVQELSRSLYGAFSMNIYKFWIIFSNMKLTNAKYFTTDAATFLFIFYCSTCSLVKKFCVLSFSTFRKISLG